MKFTLRTFFPPHPRVYFSSRGVFLRAPFCFSRGSRKFLFRDGRASERSLAGSRAGRAQDGAATFARIEKGIRGREILLVTCAATIIAHTLGARARALVPARAFARGRSAYTRWMLTCDIHVHGTHFLCSALVQLARAARDWPRRYDETFIREAAHKCQENQPNSGPRVRREGKKGGEISRDPQGITPRRSRSIGRRRAIAKTDANSVALSRNDLCHTWCICQRESDVGLCSRSSVNV